jgi:WD40 repeat protein
MLACAADDGVVRILGTASGRQLQAVHGSELPVFGVSFSPDGKTLAGASNDNTIHMWDIQPTAPLRQYLQLYRFDDLDLVPAQVNLYGNSGFRALTGADNRSN